MYRRALGVVAFLGLTLWLVGSMSLSPQLSPFLGQVALAAVSGIVTVEVKDSTGAPLEGADVVFKKGGQPDQKWGKTGSDGKLTGTLPVTGDWNVEVTYGNTKESRTVTIGTDPVTFAFQTSRIRVKLETCAGMGLEGGKVQFRANVSPGTWFDFGITGPDGAVSREMFPGNWYFRVEYKQTMTEKQQDVEADPVVTFRTTKVTLYHSGTIRYRGNPSAGTLFTFMKPSMEMLPGNIRFEFSGKELVLPVKGCSTTYTVIIIEVKNSSGNAVPGAEVYLGLDEWPYIGETGTDGKLVYAYNGVLGNMRVRVTAPNEGGTETTPFQDTAVNSVFKLQTHRLTIELRDQLGNPVNGGRVEIRHDEWSIIGTTGEHGPGVLYHEHFPGTVTIRMTYNYWTEERTHVHTAGGSTYTFIVPLVDNEPPQIVCPGNITVNVDSGTCGASVSFAATATDNCGTPTIRYYINSTEITSPYTFPVGTTTGNV